MNMQAILILAHRDLEQIYEITKILNNNFEIYIHFDTKMKVSEQAKREFEKKGIHVYQKIEVNWGGWGIAAATRYLMQEALKNPNIKYMHVISGQCYPAQKVQSIYDIMKKIIVYICYHIL